MPLFYLLEENNKKKVLQLLPSTICTFIQRTDSETRALEKASFNSFVTEIPLEWVIFVGSLLGLCEVFPLFLLRWAAQKNKNKKKNREKGY